MKISFIVIAKNEEKMIDGCLKSISWADEIIVVNHGSIDKTALIAKENGAKVINLPKEEKFNYSKPRNAGLKSASGDFIFYLDADERATPELRKELQSFDSKFNYYAIPRKNIILGQEMHHGGWWPDYVKRFYKRSELKGWSGDLHEEPQIKGEIGHFKNPIVHLKHEDIHEMLEKTNTWSEIEARLMYKAGHPKMNIPRFISAMWREFFYRMVKKSAFLDGPKGVIMAIYQVYSRFISYAKLWEIQIKNESSNL